jgi:monoamine oxidase
MGGSLASQISYDPELPELRKGLHETIDKDHCLIKTHTTYERPFWRDMNASGITTLRSTTFAMALTPEIFRTYASDELYIAGIFRMRTTSPSCITRRV